MKTIQMDQSDFMNNNIELSDTDLDDEDLFNAVNAILSNAVEAEPYVSRVQQIAEPSVARVQQIAEPSVSPVQQIAQPSVSPVQQIAQPSVSPVQQIAQPSVSPVQQITEPSVSPVQQIAEPSVSSVKQTSLPMRFINHQSLDDFLQQQQNLNTERKTTNDIKLLQSYVDTQNESRFPQFIPPCDLDNYASGFLLSVRKTDCTEFEPSTLRSFVSSVNRHLITNSYKFSIMTDAQLLHIKVRLPVLLCAVKTVEGDFRFCWTISPNGGQTHKENPNLLRIFYMIFTLNDIYKQYNELHEY